MRSGWPGAISLAALVLVTGCNTRVADHRFRTPESKGAFERTVASVEQQCGGVHRAEPDRGVVTSKWKDSGARYRLGSVWTRCVVTVLPDSADGSTSVRVSFDARHCGPFATSDEDKKLNDCTEEWVPGAVQERLAEVARNIEADVFRR